MIDTSIEAPVPTSSVSPSKSIATMADKDDESVDSYKSDSSEFQRVLQQFGFGSGMKMYQKSMAEARDLETIGYKALPIRSTNVSIESENERDGPEIVDVITKNNIPRPPVTSTSPTAIGGLFDTITTTLSNISKSSAHNLTKTTSNVSRGSVAASVAPTEATATIAKAESLVRSASNVSNAQSIASISPSVASISPSIASKAASIASKSPSFASKAGSVASKTPTTALSRANSTVSASGMSLTRSRSNVSVSSTPSTVLNSTNSIARIPTVTSKVESLCSESPSNESHSPSVSNISKTGSKQESVISKTASSFSQMASSFSRNLSISKSRSEASGKSGASVASGASGKDARIAISMKRTQSNASKAESVGNVIVLKDEEQIDVVASESNMRSTESVGNVIIVKSEEQIEAAASESNMRTTTSGVESIAESTAGTTAGTFITAVASVAGTVMSILDPELQTVVTAKTDKSSVGALDDTQTNIPVIYSKDISIKEPAIVAAVDDAIAMKEEETVVTMTESRISKTSSRPTSESNDVIEEEVDRDDEIGFEIDRNNLFDGLCGDDVVLIREGLHKGFVPGLEDQPFCAAEEAVRNWCYDADEMANVAGTKNYLPFDEIEEKKTDVVAKKWFFW